MDVYTLHFDGSCAPQNPGGTAAYGFMISKNNVTIASDSGVIGIGPKMSNNLAEFTALAMGLKFFYTSLSDSGRLGRGMVLNVRGDSKVVINIMTRHWKPRSDKLYWPAYVQANNWLRAIRSTGTLVTFDHIPREQNQECDKLSKNPSCHNGNNGVDIY